ncbi:MAG: amino acid ABC transporter substrate-binding protein [Desulfobacterales bacterium]|nr:amino acid ABC transporter substrate-binding protein [Desulfobacterales bacterium]
MKRSFCITIMLLLCWNFSYSKGLVVRHIRPEQKQDQRNLYYFDVLRLALDKTIDTDGPYKFKMAKSAMLQRRSIESLATGQLIDVMWTMTSKKREERLLPIRIPILKGLLGHRVFIIRKQDKEKFALINTLEDLKKLTAGQGHDWPDTVILKANGLKVMAGSNYDGLFHMLQHGRFDYFPRGVNEPWAEIRLHKNKGLIVETTLLLEYPAPLYFFVNKQNLKLADRIERGLRLAIQDNSFDRLFRNHPANKEIFDLANMKNRKIFKLKNPLLPPETPLKERALWYTP